MLYKYCVTGIIAILLEFLMLRLTFELKYVCAIKMFDQLIQPGDLPIYMYTGNLCQTHRQWIYSPNTRVPMIWHSQYAIEWREKRMEVHAQTDQHKHAKIYLVHKGGLSASDKNSKAEDCELQVDDRHCNCEPKSLVITLTSYPHKVSLVNSTPPFSLGPTTKSAPSRVAR